MDKVEVTQADRDLLAALAIVWGDGKTAALELVAAHRRAAAGKGMGK